MLDNGAFWTETHSQETLEGPIYSQGVICYHLRISELCFRCHSHVELVFCPLKSLCCSLRIFEHRQIHKIKVYHCKSRRQVRRRFCLRCQTFESCSVSSAKTSDRCVAPLTCKVCVCWRGEGRRSAEGGFRSAFPDTCSLTSSLRFCDRMPRRNTA